MGGIANVSAYPEERNRGHIKRLFDVCFRDMKEHGQSLSMLHPFRESYYERFGYTAASNPLVASIPTAAFLHHFGRDSGPMELVRQTGSDARDRYMAWIERTAVAPNGFVLPDPASPASPASPDFWQRRLKDAIYVFVELDSEIEAAACYTIQTADSPKKLRIRDMFWNNPRAREALFRFVTNHRDQVARIQLTVPAEAPLFSWLRDTMDEIQLTMDHKPWMVRVVDVASALDGLPAADGTLKLQIEDPWCEWNRGVYSVEGSNGRLTVSRTSGTPTACADIRGLSALAYGTLDAAELIHRGWLESDAPEVVDRLFPRIPFFNSTGY